MRLARSAAVLTFIAQRLAQLVPTLFFVSLIIFSLQQLLPGDPALVMAGEERDAAVIEQIRRQYRLDQPLPVQYVYWVKGALSGDLGESMRIKEKVLDLIVEKLPVTIQLASMAIVIALVIGIGAGILSAVKKDTLWDYGANAFALWGSAMLQVMESDYVRTARAKGLLERTVIFKHAMRNALTPVITLGALEFGTLLSGAVLTEQIFTIPGFGKMIVDAVFNRDYAVVQGVVLVTATTYITLNLLADVLYVLVNPRLRA